MSRTKRNKVKTKIWKNSLSQPTFHKWISKSFWIMKIQRLRTRTERKMHNPNKMNRKTVNRKDNKRVKMKAKQSSRLDKVKGNNNSRRKGSEGQNTRVSPT
jgi:hypothetical protein